MGGIQSWIFIYVFQDWGIFIYVKRINIYKTCIECQTKITVQNLGRHIPACIKRKNQKVNRVSAGCASTWEKEYTRREKISNTMKKNPKSGGLREGSGRGTKQWYDSPIAGKVYLRSTYEIEYVKWLDENKIQWKQNLIKFPYEWRGTIRYYYPDFFLPDVGTFIEIKGYKTLKDEAKWKNFPYPLKVLFREDLKNLGLNIV